MKKLLLLILIIPAFLCSNSLNAQLTDLYWGLKYGMSKNEIEKIFHEMNVSILEDSKINPKILGISNFKIENVEFTVGQLRFDNDKLNYLNLIKAISDGEDAKLLYDYYKCYYRNQYGDTPEFEEGFEWTDHDGHSVYLTCTPHNGVYLLSLIFKKEM